jgi:hypothetical protein
MEMGLAFMNPRPPQRIGTVDVRSRFVTRESRARARAPSGLIGQREFSQMAALWRRICSGASRLFY